MKTSMAALALVLAPALASAAPIPRSAWISRPVAVKQIAAKVGIPQKQVSVQRNYTNGGFSWIDGPDSKAGTISNKGLVLITGKLVPATTQE